MEKVVILKFPKRAQAGGLSHHSHCWKAVDNSNSRQAAWSVDPEKTASYKEIPLISTFTAKIPI